MRSAAIALSIAWAALWSLRAQEIRLHAGTLVECALQEPAFSSQTAQVGDPLHCHLAPLREFGRSAFPRSSYLVGRFRDYREPGRLAGKGWLKLEFDQLVLPAAEVPVATKIVSVQGYHVDGQGRILGHGHPKRDLAGWLIPPLWPVKIVTLPMRGPRPVLKGEIPIVLRLLEDVSIPRERP